MYRIKEELEKLESIGQLRKVPQINTKKQNIIEINGTEYINFASNDYLGISTNEALIDEFLTSHIEIPLFSSASSRLLSGNSREFTALEITLATLFKKEACLIFNTGYQCNLGVISTLCDKNTIVFSDKLNHASIIDGMKLADGEFYRYKHLDYEHLETMLKTKRNGYKRAIIISESVFSMDGDIANIDKLVELKNKYDCLLMIDEAHAFCTVGEGLCGLSDGKDVDIITATFGKALGSFGAFCVSNNDIINYLVNKARSFIFSTSLPPVNIEWTNWLLTEKIEFLKEQKNKLNILTDKVHKLYKSVSNSQIIPIIIGSNEATLKIAEELKAKGYYIPAIRPPTVPEGSSRLRLSLTAETKLEDVKTILASLV